MGQAIIHGRNIVRKIFNGHRTYVAEVTGGGAVYLDGEEERLEPVWAVIPAKFKGNGGFLAAIIQEQPVFTFPHTSDGEQHAISLSKSLNFFSEEVH